MDRLKVGDVVSFDEPHPLIPTELLGKFFRVESVDEIAGTGQLSRPYVDRECSKPYYGLTYVRWVSDRAGVVEHI